MTKLVKKLAGNFLLGTLVMAIFGIGRSFLLFLGEAVKTVFIWPG